MRHVVKFRGGPIQSLVGEDEGHRAYSRSRVLYDGLLIMEPSVIEINNRRQVLLDNY